MIRHKLFVAAVAAVLSTTGIAGAASISGTISSTLTLTSNSQLVGDVQCTVTGAPCILFGASNIVLKLNGHTITGNGSRASCGAFVGGEDGINTGAQSYVSIQGPGIVRSFRQRGIEVTGNDSSVRNVTVLSSCLEGILVGGTYNDIEENSVVRSALAASNITGIWVQGSGHHAIRNNEIVGNGHGIFVGFDTSGSSPSTNNVIVGNSTSANPSTGIFVTIGSIGNHIENNQSLGNVGFDDIFDQNPVGSNDYHRNLCEISAVGSTSTNVCTVPAPDLSGHSNPDERD